MSGFVYIFTGMLIVMCLIGLIIARGQRLNNKT